jgi:predicted RNA-binding Zn ribbon-like protein
LLKLNDFLDASFALAVEDHTRINPLQGVEAATERCMPVTHKREVILQQRDVKAQNKSSMDALQAMLAAVPNAPTKKPRKTK